MLVESHLDIETHKFTQVTVSEGIFSSEDWSYLEDTLKVRTYAHLLVQLRGLSEESGGWGKSAIFQAFNSLLLNFQVRQ